jgi:hypothetical protein
MKCIIAGSRDLNDYEMVDEAVRLSGFRITEVLSGTARGVDQLGEAWAASNGVAVRRFPADWRRFGRRAGRLRNEEMVAAARQAGGALIAVWNGVSPGTRHTIEIARRAGLPVFILRVP